MFKKIFIELCNKKNIAPTTVCLHIGLSNAAFSQWDDTSVPRKSTLYKIADYFGVSVDYLLGKEEVQKTMSEISSISASEKELLHLFRAVSEDKREWLMQTIRFILNDN